MSGHTKGPWQYRESNSGREEYAVYVMENGKEVLITRGGCGCCNDDDECIEKEDDARLIASAPDLLEALEGMLQIYGVTEANLIGGSLVSATEVECCNIARAAIAKARGAK